MTEHLNQLRSGVVAAQLQAIEALHALVDSGGLHALDEAVSAALDELLRDEPTPSQVKLRIIALWGAVQDEAQSEAIMERVRWARHHLTDFQVQKQAYEVLERRFQGDVVDQQIFILRHHFQTQDRLQAVRALAGYDDSRVVPALKVAFLTYADQTLRQAAAEVFIDKEKERGVAALTSAIIGGKLSHYWVTSRLRLKRVTFDGAKMMALIREKAPQSVLDEIEQVGRNMSNR